MYGYAILSFFLSFFLALVRSAGFGSLEDDEIGD